MEFVSIGNTDLKASRIALGTWAIGGWMWGGSEEKDSIETILTAFEKGINIIDSAPVYGFGNSEEICGKAIKKYGSREKIIIATKAGLDWYNGKVFRNASKQRIFKEIDDSLKRLKTEYIDIYQIHWPDYNIPLEETAEAMNTLFVKGKIKSIGTSNFSVEEMEIFRKEAPIHTNQPPYNLYERDADTEVLPYCYANNIITLAYGAICRGLLSGKMTIDTKFKGDDLRKYDPKFDMENFSIYLKTTALLDSFAKSNYQKNVIDLALRWILDKNIEIAVWGARKPSQLDNLENIWGWEIGDDGMQEIDRILKENILKPVGPEFMAPAV